jgi:hypothetical protein
MCDPFLSFDNLALPSTSIRILATVFRWSIQPPRLEGPTRSYAVTRFDIRIAVPRSSSVERVISTSSMICPSR